MGAANTESIAACTTDLVGCLVLQVSFLKKGPLVFVCWVYLGDDTKTTELCGDYSYYTRDLVLEGSTSKTEDIHRFQVYIGDEKLPSYMVIIW